MRRTEVCHRGRRGESWKLRALQFSTSPQHVAESEDIALDVMMSWVEAPRMAWRLQLFGGPEVVGEG
jgi:hypothetical protein